MGACSCCSIPFWRSCHEHAIIIDTFDWISDLRSALACVTQRGNGRIMHAAWVRATGAHNFRINNNTDNATDSDDRAWAMSLSL